MENSNRNLSSIEKKNQEVLELLWNVEIVRWFNFIDEIKRNPAMDNYKGYTVINNHSDRNCIECTIIISETLKIEFGCNSSVEYISYNSIYSSVGGIYKYSNGSYGISACGYNTLYFKKLICANTLFEYIISTAFSLINNGHSKLQANSIRNLLKILEENFGITLTEFEKEALNTLDSLCKEYEIERDMFLCDSSKEG